MQDKKKEPKESEPLGGAGDANLNFVQQIIKNASWKVTLACGCACISTLLWPQLPDTTSRILLLAAGTSLGACIGRPFDPRPVPDREKSG